MSNAWVVRPKPHGYNRLEEFLNQEIVAIGWPELGDLSTYNKNDIRGYVKEQYDWNSYKVGQTVGQVNRFVNKFEDGDLVVVPSGGNIYIGDITSDYNFDETKAPDDLGYPHQREVDWRFDGDAINRSSLPGQLHDSLKGRLTVFSLEYSQVDNLLDSELDVRERDQYADLQEKYLEQLEQGKIRGIQSSSFEDVVETVLDNYFPNITRQATTSNEIGDTDLKADLPGGVTVRVQVKHFYPDQGELPAKAVSQLEKSMTPGDNGIVVTSTKASDEAVKAANASNHQIGIIDGSEFVELIFENLEDFTNEELRTLGLQEQPPEIRI